MEDWERSFREKSVRRRRESAGRDLMRAAGLAVLLTLLIALAFWGATSLLEMHER
jgi:hypothetical protein